MLLRLLLLSGACLAINLRPIIGILTQPCPSHWSIQCESFINSDYVKWLEASGARIVPVHFNASSDELSASFSAINGLLYPGGADLLNGTQYYRAAKFLFELAKDANDGGDYFPLWGTCLGFQFMSVVVADSIDVLTLFDAENISLPLRFTPFAKSSRMMSHLESGGNSADAILIAYLANNPATENYHHYGVLPSTFSASQSLVDFFSVISTSFDRNQVEFISSFEAKRYPFFAVQYHPERSLFEWDPTENVDHSSRTIEVMQDLGRFFVRQTSLNHHRFPSAELEIAALIENYSPVFSFRLLNDDWQMYTFS